MVLGRSNFIRSGTIAWCDPFACLDLAGFGAFFNFFFAWLCPALVPLQRCRQVGCASKRAARGEGAGCWAGGRAWGGASVGVLSPAGRRAGTCPVFPASGKTTGIAKDPGPRDGLEVGGEVLVVA